MKESSRLGPWVYPALVLPAIGTWVYFVPLAGTPWSLPASGLLKTLMVAWPLVVVLGVQGAWPRWRAIDWRRHLRAIPLGLAVGAGIGLGMVLLYAFTPAGPAVADFGPVIRDKLDQLGLLEHYLLLCVFIALWNSLFEEYYWRWFVFGRLQQMVPLGMAYLLAGGAFALHHYVILWCYFPPLGALVFGTLVGVGGAIWCWMFHRQRSLAGCWISHVVVDAVMLALGYRLMFA